MTGRYSVAVLCLLASAFSSVLVDGFVAPASTANTVSRSVAPLFDVTGWDNFCVETDENRSMLQTSPEMARRYRRTVYTHDDWKKHRQQDRFLIYLGSMFRSGVFENCKNEVLVTTSFAAFLCFYNALRGGYTDISGIAHPAPLPGQLLGLPMTTFTLTGSSLGLLLSKFQLVSCIPVLQIVNCTCDGSYALDTTTHCIACSEYFYCTTYFSPTLQLSVPTRPTNVGTKPERTGG